LKIRNFIRKLIYTVSFLITCLIALSGCTTSSDLKIEDFAKTSIDAISDIHLEQITEILKTLTIKLYKKNPSELIKVPGETIVTRFDTIFECPANRVHEELNFKKGTDAILLGFEPEYKGDRVFAIVYGLYTMILNSYNDKCQLFILDYLNHQNLYNSARNIEILVWKLQENRMPNGDLFLLTNSIEGEDINLSYERKFGKLISLQDTMALIVANRTNRVIKKVVHIVGMSFLPVGL
jgi:hypothetical protein